VNDALDFDWAVPNITGPDFVPLLRRIQERTPVFWSERQNAWLVTRYPDVSEGLLDRRLSNHRMHLVLDPYRKGDVFRDYPEFTRAILRWVFNVDQPDHTRLRKLIVRPFSRTEADRHRGFATAALEQLIAGRDRAEFITDIAMPYTCHNLLHGLGVDDVIDMTHMIRWATSIATAFGTSFIDPTASEPAERSIVEITEIIGEQVRDRRIKPRGDLLTQLVQLSEGGDRLTTEEIVHLFQVLLLGGFETTANTLTLIVHALDSHPAQVAYIRSHPEQLTDIVDELQRFVGMVGIKSRVVAEDFEWHGQRLRAGDLVYLMLCSANRDPAAFADPDDIRFDRPRKQNMVFGPGLHHCIGHHLARMQLEVALAVLYSPHTRIQVLDRNPSWTPNPLTRNVTALPVRCLP
jgi:cytochrome P450